MEVFEEIRKYSNILNETYSPVKEAWDNKLHTKEKDKGMWEGWTLAELKAELKKLKDNPKKTESLKKREKQVTFAIRAKQKNKWGNIKESQLSVKKCKNCGDECKPGDTFCSKECRKEYVSTKGKKKAIGENIHVTPGPFSKNGKIDEIIVKETRIAAKVAADKEKHPEKYCKNKKCLYKTDDEYCPKHTTTKNSTLKESYKYNEKYKQGWKDAITEGINTIETMDNIDREIDSRELLDYLYRILNY
jgi:hypothetical protein